MKISLEDQRFTSRAQTDDLVREHIKILTNELSKYFEDHSLILTGSFGRGEGIVRYDDAAGKYKVVNDYDFLVYKKEGFSYFERCKIRAIAKNIAKKLDVWHLDLEPISNSFIENNKESMLMHDTKNGGVVVFGKEDLLRSINQNAKGQVPNHELLNLLINRMVSLFEAHPHAQKDMSKPFKARQLSKVWFALIDAITGNHGKYKTHYKEKIQEFEKINSEQYKDLNKLKSFAIEARDFAIAEDKITVESLLTGFLKLGDLLKEEITKLSATVYQHEANTEETRVNWRNNNKHSILKVLRSFLQRLPYKVEIEKEMFLELGKAKNSDPGRIEELISLWYKSI